MASTVSYTTVPGKIPVLLTKIREVGVPQKVNRDWLKSIGFRSSNDYSLIGVLKQIGFVDASNAPTQDWKDYRGAKYKSVLGKAILSGYADVYATYPDAHNRPNTDLESFFSTRSSAGKQAIDKMVSTFKTLAQNADFQGAESGVVAPITDGGQDEVAVVNAQTRGAGVIINLNIQLTLPETTDEKVYDKFFASMKKHLMDAAK